MPASDRLSLHSRDVAPAFLSVRHRNGPRRWACALVFLIVSVAGARHASCAQNAGAQGEQESSSVRGRVINKVTSEPIAGSRVLLESDRQLHLAPPSVSEAKTDGEGRFVLAGLAPGRYSLRAESDGFVGTGPSRNASGATGMLLYVGKGQNLDRLKIELVPVASVSGRVTDPEGVPLRNVEVTLLGRYYPPGRETYQPVGSGRSDDRGEYRIFDLPPGQYLLSATPRAARNMSSRVRSQPDDTVAEAEFGTVIYPNASDPSGGAQIQLAPGQELYGIDVRMERRRRGRIVGKVVKPPGTGLASLWLTPEWLAGRPGPRRIIESSDGTFAFTGVAPGRYSIIASATTNEGAISGKGIVEVGEDFPANTEVILSNGGVLRGRVVTADEGELPVEAKHVALTPFEPGGLVFAPVRAAEIASDGSFELSRVGTDRYRIQIGTLPEDYYISAAYLGDEEVLASGIDGSRGLSGGVPLRIVLSPNAARVAGTVESREGLPAAGATVVLIPEDGGRRTQFYLCPWTTTDSYGNFSIAQVEPRKYRALAWREVSLGRWTDPDFLGDYWSKAEELDVEKGSAVEIRLLEIEKHR